MSTAFVHVPRAAQAPWGTHGRPTCLTCVHTFQTGPPLCAPHVLVPSLAPGPPSTAVPRVSAPITCASPPGPHLRLCPAFCRLSQPSRRTRPSLIPHPNWPSMECRPHLRRPRHATPYARHAHPPTRSPVRPPAVCPCVRTHKVYFPPAAYFLAVYCIYYE